MITNLIIDLEHKQPCSFRTWQCPVTFKIGDRNFRNTWSWFDDAQPTEEIILQRTEDHILQSLAEVGYQTT